MSRPNCRCAGLRAAFGFTAKCAACTSEAKRLELIEQGFESVPLINIRDFQDCGVDVRTILHPPTAWVPCWAALLFDMLGRSRVLGPLLGRCAVDQSFAEACVAIALLWKKQVDGDPMMQQEAPGIPVLSEQLRSFAEAQGVTF